MIRITIERFLISKIFKKIIRIAYLLAIGIALYLCLDLYFLTDKILYKKQVFQDFYKIQNQVYNLEINTSDSLLENLKNRSTIGYMTNWKDAALWLENLRSLAIKSEIDFTYEIDSLILAQETQIELYRLPIFLSVFPLDGTYETVMQFLEKLLQDQTFIIRLDDIEFIADDRGLNNTYIRLTAWMRL